MSTDIIYSLTGVFLFFLGLFGVCVSAHIVRKLIAVNIMGVGVFMLCLATALHDQLTDPILHAMVLTGIVVAVAGTALCLWLAINFFTFGNLKPSRTE